MLQRTSGRTPHYDPRDDSNWENCQANQREGEEYLLVVLDAAQSTRLVGEDLGTVPPYVRPSLQSLGIAGFKIPQWENTPDNQHVIRGSDYQRLSVTTYATHDHKPIRAMWDDAFAPEETAEREQARGDLRKISEFAGVHSLGENADFDRDFYAPITRALFASNAWMAIVMITDLLARKDRFNVPGTAKSSNWSRRLQMTVSRLRASRTVKHRMRIVRDLIGETGRA